MQDDSQAFMRAAKSGDTPEMKSLIGKNIPQTTLTAALLNAIQTFNFTTCRFIINETSLSGNEITYRLPLIAHAFRANNLTATGLLLTKPTFNFRQSVDGLTLIEALARDGHAPLLGDVLKKNIFSPQECKSALMIATINEQADTVKELLRHGTSPNDYPHNITPLHRAAAIANVKVNMVRTLLTGKDIAVDQEDANGYTPLFIALDKDNIVIARLLVDKGACPEKTRRFASSIHEITVLERIDKYFANKKTKQKRNPSYRNKN